MIYEFVIKLILRVMIYIFFNEIEKNERRENFSVIMYSKVKYFLLWFS